MRGRRRRGSFRRGRRRFGIRRGRSRRGGRLLRVGYRM